MFQFSDIFAAKNFVIKREGSNVPILRHFGNRKFTYFGNFGSAWVGNHVLCISTSKPMLVHAFKKVLFSVFDHVNACASMRSLVKIHNNHAPDAYSYSLC